MKAITCSQCGALIKGVSPTTKFVDCKYCGAEIPTGFDEDADKRDNLPQEQARLKKFTNEEKTTLFRSPDNENLSSLNQDSDVFRKGAVIVIACGIVFMISLFAISISSNKKNPVPPPTPRTAVTMPSPYPTPALPKETPTPFPDFSYRAYVKYFTDVGVEDAVVPVINEDQLPTMDIAVLKKTVFKEKRIRVRITINPDGEVIDAKPLNGHPALQEICIIAAKKSLFTTRKRNYTADLTYIFVIES